MTTYVFPGQGSQIIGMGADLFHDFESYVQQANTILGYDLVELCLKDPNKLLNNTQYTQPALYTVNALSYFKKLKEVPLRPDFVIGHSLGEYNALLAAEVFDFETGIKLVQKRGELMGTALGGGMAAIIGLQEDQIQTILHQKRLDTLSISNYNSTTQIVISGPARDIIAAQDYFQLAGAKAYVPLNVSGAFHSNYMKNTQQLFSKFLSQFSFSPPTVQIISSIYARPISAAETSNYLENQITQPVHWTQSIHYLLERGETVFEEVGSQKVLTKLIQNIQNGL